jgi:hypothetical protein
VNLKELAIATGQLGCLASDCSYEHAWRPPGEPFGGLGFEL